MAAKFFGGFILGERYVLQHHQESNFDLGDVPSLPSPAYELLRAKFRPLTSSLSSALDSKDGLTTKLLIRLQVIPTGYTIVPSLPQKGKQRKHKCKRK